MSTVRDGNPRGRLDQLARAIFHEWRTPQAMTPNALRGQGQDPIKRAAQGHQVNLQDQMVIYGRPDPVSPSTDGSRRGLLNPLWVEALMGLPIGWTDCAYSATESSPQLQP